MAPFGRSQIFCSFSDADNSNSIIKDFLMLVIYFDTFFAHFLRIINNMISSVESDTEKNALLNNYNYIIINYKYIMIKNFKKC